jgi:hypothetical protein
MADPMELIAEGIRALSEQDPHALPDTALLTSAESIFTAINRLNGVVTSRLQVMHVRDDCREGPADVF